MLENSASPAESNVYIVLCFPRKEGGYGIVRPELNGKVEIKLSNGEVHNRFCDFLWGLALAGEYYGEKSHSNKSAFLNDATRQGELAAQGIRIIPITADHTASITKMDRIAESIEQILGIRKRGLPQDFQKRQLELHTMLFPWAH